MTDPPSRFGGRATEQEHTFSNPLSFKYELPNWLVLNFGWHNAHHLRPTVPGIAYLPTTRNKSATVLTR